MNIWLMYARYNGKGKWKLIVGPMWTNEEKIKENIAKHTKEGFVWGVEYKAVKFTLSETDAMEFDDEPELIDPRVPALNNGKVK